MIVIGVVCLISSFIISLFLLKKNPVKDVLFPGIVLVITALVGVSFTSMYLKARNEVKVIKRIIEESPLDRTMARYINNYVGEMKRMPFLYFLTGLDSIEVIDIRIIDD